MLHFKYNGLVMGLIKHYIKHNWRLLLTVFTFFALGITVFALRRQIVETIQNLADINSAVLLLMIPAQMLNYIGQTQMHRGFFEILNRKFSFRSMLRVMLELNFVNNIFPSGGVSGISYFGLRMRHYGVPGGLSTLIQIMKFGFLFISYLSLLFVGLIFLAVEGKANGLLLLISGSIMTILVIVTLGVSFIIGSERRINAFFTYITRVINRLIRVVRPNHPETINIGKARELFTDLHANYGLIRKDLSKLRQPFLAATLANVGELLTVYVVYLAFGEFINPGAIIIALAVANFAGFISVLPGGVGIFEALMTTVLIAAGVPAALSLSVTVTYRVLNMLIQLPPGYYFYHKMLREPGIKEAADGNLETER